MTILTDTPAAHEPELRRSKLAPLFKAVYRLVNGRRRRRVGGLILNLLRRFEGDAYRTATVRDLLLRDFGVEIGAYSYGDCFIPGAFPPKTVIGRYVSIAAGVRVFNQNHPMGHVSTHPFFYAPQFGVIEALDMPRHETRIEHDVWIGRNAIITPGCRRIGVGAVVGAGAVVTKDVDDYAIVAGNPAKLIKYRFDETTRAALLASRWWTCSAEQCRARWREFVIPATQTHWAAAPLTNDAPGNAFAEAVTTTTQTPVT